MTYDRAYYEENQDKLKARQREYRKKWRWEDMLKKNQCPMCGMRLEEEYAKFHKGCPFLAIDNNGKIPFLQDKE